MATCPSSAHLSSAACISSSNSLPRFRSLVFSLFQVNHFAVCSTRSIRGLLTLKRLPQASSSEGLPVELVEDSKFVPLNSDDPQYGPPALLLLGFESVEAVEIQKLLKEMDGEFLKVIYCTEEMMTRPLWEIMNTKQTNSQGLKIAKSVPRICFLSGLSGEEMTIFIDAFSETRLAPAVFAALVPNSANKPLQELMEEIMGDHEMLSAKQLVSE